MPEFAITVIGHDRPGIIAEAAEILAGLRLNLTDSTMTRLRRHFAMTLICASETDAGGADSGGSGAQDAATVEAALQPLTAGGLLLVAVRHIEAEIAEGDGGSHHVLTVHGADKLGIVAHVSRLVAEAGGNITDLTTRLAGGLYLLVAEVDLPRGTAVQALGDRLRAAAAEVGVDAALRAADADVL